MARVTVEKCRGMVRDSFELVALAAVRAKDINSGAPLTVERDNDKDSVVALREIEAGYIKIESLKERLVAMLQKGSLIEKQQEEIRINLEEDSEIMDDFALDAEEITYEIQEQEFDSSMSFEDEELGDEDEK